VPAEREQPRLIPRHERLEGSLIPTPYERDETLVRLQSEQRRTTVKAGRAGVLKG